METGQQVRKHVRNLLENRLRTMTTFKQSLKQLNTTDSYYGTENYSHLV